MNTSTFTTELVPENFSALVAERINDAALRLNVRRATGTSLEKREKVVADFPDWEERRETARRIKEHVLAHLGDYLRLFEKNAVAAGMHVHFARNADEARAVIVALSLEAEGRVAVKSKSMTSEEIELGAALLQYGIEAVETDLGEYIVQLAGEMPSHITAPALHLSRDQIGALFARSLDIPFTNDPAELTAIARRVLRERFLEAGIGISGVNFAVAESGAICIVENEANARMSTTLPRMHIALMGMEKLVPDTRSLTHMLSMLARSATGQRLSCYTNIIAAPRRADEWDGPEEIHIVILDNGRSRLLADPRLRESLACIRCGACMNTCPVYRTVGGHAYGSVYPGPIGSVLTPVFQGRERSRALPYASSLCGACSEICPVKIDIHHLLLYHRRRIVEETVPPLLERLAMKLFLFVARSPLRYRAGAALLRAFAPLLRGAGEELRVPVWSRARVFPAPADSSFREQWQKRAARRGAQ